MYTAQFSNNEYFGNFYDANKQNWSIRFETSDESDNLAIYVAVAKYIEKGAGTQNELILQDLLVPAKGVGVSDGDTVGMRYTLWTEQTGKLNKVEDNSDKNAPLRLVLGTKKGPVGLDAAIEGMRKGGRRAVIVPPGFESNGDSEAKVYKLTLEKLKRGAANAGADNEAPSANGKATPASPHQDGPAGRGRSSSDAGPALAELPAVGDVQQEKAALLKRIAKMGVATLGGPPPTADAQEWDTNGTPQETAPPMPHQHQQAPQQAQPPMTHQIPQQYNQPPPQQQSYIPQPQQPYMQIPGGMNPYQPQQPAGFPNGMPGVVGPYGQINPYLPQQQAQPTNQLALISGPNPFAQQFLLAQAQQAAAVAPAPATPEPAKPATSSSSSDNAETIKVLVEERQLKSEINSKLDKVEKRVDDIHTMMDDSMFIGKAKDLAPGISSKQLLVTIQRIVMENEKYSAEMDAKSARIESLTEKIAKLHETNQRVVEENNHFLEERSTNYRSSTESTLKQLEQFRNEKLELETELTKSQKQFQTLKRAYTNLSAEMEEFKQQHDRARKEADAAVSRSATLDARAVDLEERLRESESMTKRVQAALDQAHVDLEAEREQVARLTQVMEEHKAKFIAELTKRETQWETERTDTASQLEQLREALRRERAQVGTSAQQLEAELQTQFAAKIKHELEQRENQLNQQRELELQEQRIMMENEFRSRVKLLREEQAAHIDQANQENAHMRAQLIATQAKLSDLAAQLQNANIFATNAAAPGAGDSGEVATLKQQLRAVRIQSIKDFETKVKLIMNSVYQSLNGEFADENDEQYNKAAVMSTVRQTIVQTTVQLVEQTQEQLRVQEEQEREALTQAAIREVEEAEVRRQAEVQKALDEAQRIKDAEEAALLRAQLAAANAAAAKAQAEADAAAQLAAVAEAEAAKATADAAAAVLAAEAEEARRVEEAAARSTSSLSASADEPVEGEEVTLPLGKSVESASPASPTSPAEEAALSTADPLSTSVDPLSLSIADPLASDPLSSSSFDPLSALGADDNEEDSLKTTATSFVQPLPPAVETEESSTRSKSPEPVVADPLSSNEGILPDDDDLLAAQAIKASLLDDEEPIDAGATDPLSLSNGGSEGDIDSAPGQNGTASPVVVPPSPVVEAPVEPEPVVVKPDPKPDPKPDLVAIPTKSADDVFGDSSTTSEDVHPLSRGAIFDSAAQTPATSNASSVVDPLASLDGSASAPAKPTPAAPQSTSSAIFDDPLTESVPVEPAKPSSQTGSAVKTVFDESDDEDDFMKSITSKAKSRPAAPADFAAAAETPSPAAASPAPAKKASSLFEIFGDDDAVPSEPKASTPQPSSGKAGRKSLDELFGMDDSASGSASAPASSAKPARKKALFDDDDE